MKAERSDKPHADDITVLLVDDHTLVRRGFRRMLEDESHITVVGEASDGVGAIQMACELKPRVVLMDWVMPNMNGLVATSKILQECARQWRPGLADTFSRTPWIWIWVWRSGAWPLVTEFLLRNFSKRPGIALRDAT
jgi:CheY-like chemotaxis protein